MLSRLAPTLRALPDLERLATRALHRTASPRDFLTALQSFAGLHASLGLHADLGAAAAAGGEGEAPGVELAGVRSELLAALLRAAGSLALAAAAREMLACIDEAAAAANNKLELFR